MELISDVELRQPLTEHVFIRKGYRMMSLEINRAQKRMLGYVLLFILWQQCVTFTLDFNYHDNASLESYMKYVSETYPSITELYSIGKSVLGVDLWVIAIGKDLKSHVTLRPHVKYVGNMHGNEVVSREMLLHLIDHYVKSYGANDTITSFLNNTVVHIMPSMNPDGFASSTVGDCTGIQGRANANNKDLNRNFPDYFKENKEPLQKETMLVMNWTKNHSFVLSANLHGGTLVVNYPFDNYVKANRPKYSRCPDDDVFIHISKTYSYAHSKMYTGEHCGDSFKYGITNGAMWYPVTGGMQDWNYIEAGCFETTFELSCCKYPEASTLPSFWDDNKHALVEYLLQAHMGVKGIVTDENGNVVSDASVMIEGREMIKFNTTEYGEYWRLLLPGTYTIQVQKGLSSTQKQITVEQGMVTRADLRLGENPLNSASRIYWFYLPFTISLYHIYYYF